MNKVLQLFFSFLKIGLFTFGGGYAMVSLIEGEFVAKRRWVDENEFLDMIAIAESTPGPIAINSATYIGYKISGIIGATAATIAVCIPSFVIIYIISLFFEKFLSLKYVSYAFEGIQVCVIYLIFSAGIFVGRIYVVNILRLFRGTGRSPRSEQKKRSQSKMQNI